MKKSHRKDVLIARIIFAAILLALITVIVIVVMLLVPDDKPKKQNTQKESQTETQIQMQEPPVVTPDTEPVVEEVIDPPVEEAISLWTTDRVNFRSEPNTECEVIKVLARGTEVMKQSEENGWVYVEYDGQTGYISGDFVTEEEPTATGKVVVIDPGHQRSGDSTQEPNGPNSSTMKARVTSGTTGRTTGVAEYELNLDVSLQLRDELESRGYTVYMTRETHDVNISNMERAQYATTVGADIAVRIHANGAEDSSVNGALTLAPSTSNAYVGHLAGDSQSLSRYVLDEYCASTGMRNRGVNTTDTMTGINWSTVPVTILELGFMTNSTDDTNMQEDSYQQKMVQGIANGIDAYFGVSE